MAIPDPEFFILIPQDFTFAFEVTEFTGTEVMTPDVVDAATSVAGTNNANPDQITTTAPHGYRSGMAVFINGLVGDTAPNDAYWIINVTGASTFTIPVAGNGVWTSGGTITPNETGVGLTGAFGVAMAERDMLAINEGVVPPPPPPVVNPPINLAY